MYYLIAMADGPHAVFDKKSVKREGSDICRIKTIGMDTGRILATHRSPKLLRQMASLMNRKLPYVTLNRVLNEQKTELVSRTNSIQQFENIKNQIKSRRYLLPKKKKDQTLQMFTGDSFIADTVVMLNRTSSRGQDNQVQCSELIEIDHRDSYSTNVIKDPATLESSKLIPVVVLQQIESQTLSMLVPGEITTKIPEKENSTVCSLEKNSSDTSRRDGQQNSVKNIELKEENQEFRFPRRLSILAQNAIDEMKQSKKNHQENTEWMIINKTDNQLKKEQNQRNADNSTDLFADRKFKVYVPRARRNLMEDFSKFTVDFPFLSREDDLHYKLNGNSREVTRQRMRKVNVRVRRNLLKEFDEMSQNFTLLSLNTNNGGKASSKGCPSSSIDKFNFTEKDIEESEVEIEKYELYQKKHYSKGIELHTMQKKALEVDLQCQEEFTHNDSKFSENLILNSRNGSITQNNSSDSTLDNGPSSTIERCQITHASQKIESGGESTIDTEIHLCSGQHIERDTEEEEEGFNYDSHAKSDNWYIDHEMAIEVKMKSHDLKERKGDESGDLNPKKIDHPEIVISEDRSPTKVDSPETVVFEDRIPIKIDSSKTLVSDDLSPMKMDSSETVEIPSMMEEGSPIIFNQNEYSEITVVTQLKLDADNMNNSQGINQSRQRCDSENSVEKKIPGTKNPLKLLQNIDYTNVETRKIPSIHKIENVCLPLIFTRNDKTQNSQYEQSLRSMSSVSHDYIHSSPEGMDDSPYIQSVDERLSNDNTLVMDRIDIEMMRKQNNENEQERHEEASERLIRRKNIVRVLNYDSDEVDNDDDSDYVPESDGEGDKNGSYHLSDVEDDSVGYEELEKDDDCGNYGNNRSGEEIFDDIVKGISEDSVIDISTSANKAGANICNLKYLAVEPSKGRTGKDKSQFCVYCHTLQKKFARHLSRHHKSEKDVDEFLKLQPKSKERRRIIDRIRGKGNYLYNTNPDYNEGNLIVIRRPNNRNLNPRRAEDHKPCPNCKNYFTSTSLRHHFQNCTQRKFSSHRCVMTMSRIFAGQIHPEANDKMRTNIIPKLKEDKVGLEIRHDRLLIIFGNKLTIKYRRDKLESHIRNQLRRLSRILLHVKSIDQRVTDFASIFDPKFYDNIVKAINMTAELNEEETEYKAPTTASGCGTLLLQIGSTWKSQCIRDHEPEKREYCEQFLQLLREDFPASVNKTVAENQAERRRRKIIKLPSDDDIAKLFNYLQQKAMHYLTEFRDILGMSSGETSREQCNQRRSFKSWLALAEVTFTLVQIFNRRRVGDMEEFKIRDFESLQSIREADEDLYNSLDKASKDIAENYTRCQLRGKLARTVPVILTNITSEAIKLLIETRESVGIPSKNPFVFGLPPRPHDRIHRYLDGCRLMRRFSTECGASDPKSLRGTELRKHIATKCLRMKLASEETEHLIHHMGHSRTIHKDYYQQPSVALDILKTSQLLETIQQLSEQGEPDNSTNQGNGGETSINQNQDSGNSSKSQLGGKRKKVLSTDHDSMNNDQSPDVRSKRQKVLSASTSSRKVELEERLNRDCTTKNVISKKRKLLSTPSRKCNKRPRWTDEEIAVATRLYSRHINNNSLPTLQQIRQDKENHPELRNRTEVTIKTWVSNNHRRRI